jgi:hypothetical protein
VSGGMPGAYQVMTEKEACHDVRADKAADPAV